MNELPGPSVDLAEHMLMRVALRALLMTHPEPAKLRAAWDVLVSSMWTGAVPFIALVPAETANLRSAIQELQAVFEGYIDSARTP